MRLTELVTPLKPLEAMASGRLLVASDVGGHRELIRHGETGLLFKAGNPPPLGGSGPLVQGGNRPLPGEAPAAAAGQPGDRARAATRPPPFRRAGAQLDGL